MLIFLVLIAGAVAVVLYFNQKPAVIVRTVVVQPAQTPVAAPPIAAAPPPTPVETAAPVKQPEEISLPPTTIVVKPTEPACMAIEKKLRIAQDAARQTIANIAAARERALDELHGSPDYRAAIDEADARKKARQQVAERLESDRSAGADSDHDTADLRATSAAWVESQASLNKMEQDAVANDRQVVEQTQNLKEIRRQIADLQQQLGNYIGAEIHSVCRDERCTIARVSLDASTWAISADLVPAARPDAGAMADEAMQDIATILETLTQTPFTWKSAQFTVYDRIGSGRQAEFSALYHKSQISSEDFQTVHINHFQYPMLEAEHLRVGQTGIVLVMEVVQVIDHSNMLARLSPNLPLVWISGLDTSGRVDHSIIDIDVPMKVSGTKTYATLDGGSNTIFVLEPESQQRFGDYYDDQKMVDLASRIWLNPRIDQMQGGPAVPDAIVPQPGQPLPTLYNTLKIGGYTREDGSACPITLVRTLHAVHFAQADAPQNKTPSLPFPTYPNSASNPGFGLR